ncbi:hypothetical protein Tco_0842871 [Tanacetum coccineum]|uniref:Uncharacterized protein n=1 Tax=Tanacetum coccineum TaxID=301880 RepID=A0ABQ5B666_9ASTR
MLWTLASGDDSTIALLFGSWDTSSYLQCAQSAPVGRVEDASVCKTFYACGDSLLLTPLCCDDIHEVTPRVSALASYVSLIRKKFYWGTIFPIGLKRYRDPKEKPIEKEPLMELKEIG